MSRGIFQVSFGFKNALKFSLFAKCDISSGAIFNVHGERGKILRLIFTQ